MYVYSATGRTPKPYDRVPKPSGSVIGILNLLLAIKARKAKPGPPVPWIKAADAQYIA